MRVTEIYVDTSYGLMIKFEDGSHRRANDEERAKMLAALNKRPEPGSYEHMFPEDIDRVMAEQEAGAERQKRALGV